MAGLSLKAYAVHRRCDMKAVQTAIAAGRLSASVKRTKGGGYCIDPAAADAEWAATTLSDRVPLTGPTAPKNGDGSPTLVDMRLRHEAAKAAMAELELAERQGELVETAEVDQRLVGLFARCKTKLLAIPARARQQDPGLTQPQLALIDGLVREALEELAGEAPV